MPMLLGGLAGALAFAGILGFGVVKFGKAAGLHSGGLRNRRGDIWDAADANHTPPPWPPRDFDAAPAPAREPLRTSREIEAQSRDILEILSRAARSSAAT